jgi:PAS domain S-box-containing protein
VIDAMPDACFVFDKEGNYCRVMTSQEELLAAPPEELLNSDIEEQLPPELAKKCLAAIRRALETGEVQRIEYTLCVPSKERDFSARISPLAGDRVVFVARDISKQKEKERELEEIQNHLTELVKKRTEKIEKKNLALEEMIDRLERRVRKTHNKLYEKFDKNVISVLNRMIPELDSEQVERVEAIKQKIKKILKPDENIPVTSGLFEKLTNRELEIADYVRDGFSTKEIAKMIGRSSNTVRNQRASIRKKLGLKNTGESLKNFLKEYM